MIDGAALLACVPLSRACYRALFKVNTYYAGEEGESLTWNVRYTKKTPEVCFDFVVVISLVFAIFM